MFQFLQPTRFGRIAPGVATPLGAGDFQTLAIGSVGILAHTSSVTTFAVDSAVSGGIGNGENAFGGAFVGPTSDISDGIVMSSFLSTDGVVAVKLHNATASAVTLAPFTARFVEFPL